MVLILPTAEKTKEVCERIKKYAKEVFKNRPFTFLEDTAALTNDLSSYTLITYGTLTGNLWVSNHLKGLPVTIAKAAILTDQEFAGEHLRFISCWFNPANPAKAWIIYTAQDAEDVPGINAVLHGGAQFHVARTTEVLQNGYYSRKSGSWKISDLPDFDFPALTRKQMYEDYDAFTNIVQQVFPLMEVNRQVYGIDVHQLLSENREQIGSLSATEPFIELVNRTMVACRGSHFWITSLPKDDYYRGFVDERAYALADQYQTFVMLATKGSGVALPILYFKGDYFTSCDFTCGGIPYPKGMKVLTCGGRTPDAIVRELTQSGVPLNWDYDLKKFYTTDFYKFAPAPGHPGTNSPVLVQMKRADGAIVSLDLRTPKATTWKLPRNDRQPLVALVNSNILYIKLPSMSPDLIGFYRKELSGYKDKPIQKAVIDIRNNGGGSDSVWSSLLSLLLDRDVAFSLKLAAKNSVINREYLARHPFGKSIKKSGKLQKVHFLRDEEFQVLEEARSMSPDPHSLKLRCKIYVLSDNVYSSAGSLMNVCRHSQRLVSVGLPNSLILGHGIDPFAFSLPNSKLTFSIEPVIDLAGAQNARDVHHNDVEVRITPALEQLLDYYNTGTDMPLEQRLTQHDPFFQKVLELE